MLDSTLSVRYRKFRYQAQSDIADHGYRTKCPPMANKYVLTASEICEKGGGVQLLPLSFPQYKTEVG